MTTKTHLRAGIAAAAAGLTVLATLSSAAGAGPPRSIGTAPVPSVESVDALIERHAGVCPRVDVVPVEVIVLEPCTYVRSLTGAAAAGGGGAGGGGAGGPSPSQLTPSPR